MNRFARPIGFTFLLCWSLVLGAYANETGQELYNQYCAACHGSNGEGDVRWPGLNEAGDMTAPPHDERGHTWRHSTRDLVRMTLKGHRDSYNKSDFLTMPAYEGILTEGQVEQILGYISQWWKEDQRERQRKMDE